MAGNDISVLIVDDEEMVRSILQDFLDDEGFETDIAGTGREGLDLLDSKNFKAAIVDMSLPDMNGNEFIKKALEKYPDICCCVHTGSSDYTIPGELQEKGLTREHIFFKPVQDMRIFSTTIKDLLGIS